MLIDWFTVGAQVLNFLILVALMKHFLYKPILHAIDEREKKIAAELADADVKRKEAKKAQDEFQKKNNEFDQQRAGLLSKAIDDAKKEREKLFDEARVAADLLASKRLESLKQEERKLHQSLIHKTQQEVFSVARKALKDLAETDLEERIVKVFADRLKESSFQPSGMPVTIRTAFVIPETLRTSVEVTIKERFGKDTQVEFETDSNLICGIEISANGKKVAWSIADYLTSLEHGVDEILKGKERKEKKTPTKVKPIQEVKSEVKVEAKSEVKPEPKPEVTS